MTSAHADLLKISLPPVSYDATAPNLSAELTAEGNTLDAALASAKVLRDSITPNVGPLLEDWERVYGLPNVCTATLEMTRLQRLNALAAKINEGGTFTKAKAIDVAAQLGYTVTITEHRAREYGKAISGGDYGDRDWNFVWDINSAINTFTQRRYGSAVMGEKYQVWGNEVLECVFKRRAMSGTIVRFIYT